MTSFTREQVLAYRLRVNHLAGRRLPAGSLAVAARSGLQDGSPRSALLSLAARVERVHAEDWRDESLAQVFGPRGAVYVVPAEDVGVFSLGLLPRDLERLDRIERMAVEIHSVLQGGESMRQSDVVDALPDLGGSRALRWAATTGTLVATWDTVDTIVHPAPPPSIDPEDARLELAHRFFRYLGPATVKDLQWWLDGLSRDATETVATLGDSLTPVIVEGRACLALTRTLDELHCGIDTDDVLLLPPDDAYINRVHRDLLVPDPSRRKLLWPQAPPPGALVIGGEVCGTWRRRRGSVEMSPWQNISPSLRAHVEEIAAGWPLGDDVPIEVAWSEPA